MHGVVEDVAREHDVGRAGLHPLRPEIGVDVEHGATQPAMAAKPLLRCGRERARDVGEQVVDRRPAEGPQRGGRGEPGASAELEHA